MDAPATYSSDFGKIRVKMIEPAVKELMEKDGWLIDWKPIKAGRKVQSIRFEFLRNPQGSLNFERQK
jgi:plasmid replication initiation protein